MDHTAESVNLLLVNDRPAQLLAWQSILAGLDLNLVLAQSGVEAVDHLLSTDFAAILLDVQMPTMDGFETATLIRQRPRSQLVPILFVTAINTEEQDRSRGYALGAVDWCPRSCAPRWRSLRTCTARRSRWLGRRPS
jgi:hypothetical protein